MRKAQPPGPLAAGLQPFELDERNRSRGGQVLISESMFTTVIKICSGSSQKTRLVLYRSTAACVLCRVVVDTVSLRRVPSGSSLVAVSDFQDILRQGKLEVALSVTPVT